MDQRTNPQTKIKHKRPFLLKLLILGLLVFAWFGLFRFQQAIVNWIWLESLEYVPHPVYLAIGGLLWGLSSLVSAVTLWFRIPRAPFLTRITAGIIALSYWLDRMLLARSATSQVNFPFAVMLTLALIAFTIFVLRKYRNIFH